MVRGILAGETLNEFYPKVVFREDGLIELLESGPGTLTGKDFIVEPVGEWTGHMFYQGLDGAKLISVKDGEVEVTGWISNTGSFNDFSFRHTNKLKDLQEPLYIETISDSASPGATFTIFNTAGESTGIGNVWESAYGDDDLHTSMVERGNLIISRGGVYATDKNTGEVVWKGIVPAADGDYGEDHIPSLYGGSGSPIVVGGKYSIGFSNNSDGYFYVLDITTGEYVYYGDLSVDYPGQDLPEAWYLINIFPRHQPNEALLVTRDDNNDTRALILRIDNGQLSFTRHPVEHQLDPNGSFYLKYDGRFDPESFYYLTDTGEYYFMGTTRNITKFDSNDLPVWTYATTPDGSITMSRVGNYLYVLSKWFSASTYRIWKIDDSTGTATILDSPILGNVPVVSKSADPNGYFYIVTQNDNDLHFYYFDTNTDSLNLIESSLSIENTWTVLSSESSPMPVGEDGTFFLFSRGGRGVLALLGNGQVTYKQFGHELSIASSSAPIITTEGDMVVGFRGAESYALGKVTDDPLKTNYLLPSNPGVPLLAGNTYVTEGWEPGQLYPAITYNNRNRVSLGDYAVYGPSAIFSPLESIPVKPGLTVDNNYNDRGSIGVCTVWDSDRVAIQRDQGNYWGLHNMATGEFSTLFRETTLNTGIEGSRVAAYRRGSGLVSVRVRTNQVRIHTWPGTGTVWNLTSSATVLSSSANNTWSNTPTAYHNDSIYVVDLYGTDFTVHQYDITNNTWGVHDSQPKPKPDTNYGTFTSHDGVFYFTNGIWYDIDSKTWSDNPVPSNRYTNTGLYSMLDATPVVYKDILLRFTPYGIIQAQPLVDTVSPW